MSHEKRTFSKPFNDAIIQTEMIAEMAIEDGWKSLDECLAQAPQALAIFTRHAAATIRVMRQVEKRENSIRPRRFKILNTARYYSGVIP